MSATAIEPALTGLSDTQVAERRSKGEGNTAPPATTRTYGQIVRENVFTFINNVLFLLGLALVLVGRPLDAVISVGVISLNVLVSVVQEIRAKRTLDRIALLTRPTAAVVRNGREQSVAPDELVLGDVIKLGLGDQVVLDGVVLDGQLQVDESQLTGESDLIEKKPGDELFSGSFCVSGGCFYEVRKVGAASLANQITAGARSFRRVLTPLQRQINFVIRIMLLIVVYLQLLLTLDALLKQVQFADAVGNATILAGLVPNGLFVSIAVAYAVAAVRIIRYGALVQQSNAIESLSMIDVLCLDKTGTLTANQLAVNDVHPFTMQAPQFKTLLGTMAASTAAPNKTSGAIATAFAEPALKVIAEVPFSSARKWSALAFGEGADGAAVPGAGVYALGAPEFVRPYLGVDDARWTEIQTQAAQQAATGLRLLIVAFAPAPAQLVDAGDDSRLPQGMQPLGLVSLTDVLRPEAKQTLSSFAAAGVAPKIISGDNPETVSALAKEAGLPPDIRLVSGLDLDAMDDAMLADTAESATIFGRITPQQKQRLVQGLRSRNHYVAMIGDGVNDVLSLKQSNLGIAMQSGSQAARGVADIVLMNDSFAALLPAVVEGQRIRNGMQDILKLFLSRISTIALLIVSSLVIGIFPISLRNGSLITLLTVGIPTILLALWAQPGQPKHDNLRVDLAHFVVPAAVLSSFIGLLVFYGTIFLYGLETPLPALEYTPINLSQTPFGPAIALAHSTLAVFLICCGLLLVVFVEPPNKWWAGGDVVSSDRRPALLAAGLLAILAVIISVPLLRALFDLQPMGVQYLGLVLVMVLAWLLLIRLTWRYRLLERFLGRSTNTRE